MASVLPLAHLATSNRLAVTDKGEQLLRPLQIALLVPVLPEMIGRRGRAGREVTSSYFLQNRKLIIKIHKTSSGVY